MPVSGSVLTLGLSAGVDEAEEDWPGGLKGVSYPPQPYPPPSAGAPKLKGGGGAKGCHGAYDGGGCEYPVGVYCGAGAGAGCGEAGGGSCF